MGGSKFLFRVALRSNKQSSFLFASFIFTTFLGGKERSLGPHVLQSPWNSLGQNTGVGSLSLLQGIFPNQGSNPGFPNCRWILYQLSHQGSPQLIIVYFNNTFCLCQFPTFNLTLVSLHLLCFSQSIQLNVCYFCFQRINFWFYWFFCFSLLYFTYLCSNLYYLPSASFGYNLLFSFS